MIETVLVSGGAGFLGSHLADALFALNYRVVILDDLSGGQMSNIDTPYPLRQHGQYADAPDIHFVRGSILDVKLVDELFARWKFAYVYHCAAYAAEGLSHFIKRFNYNNNLIGSVNLINAAVNHDVRCFVFTSSMAVYGSAQVPMREDMTPAPEDSYGIAKYAVEQELKCTKELFGLDYVIFRPHNIVGIRQNIADRYRNVAGIFMSQILRNQPMTIFGDGEQVRAFSPVEDIVPIIASSPLTPAALGEVFNIGGEQAITINELATMVALAMNVPRKVVHLEARHEVKLAYCDHAKVRATFGLAQSLLPAAILKMANWAKLQPSRAIAAFEGIEIEKNLPQYWRD